MSRILPLIILAMLFAAADPTHAATRIYKWVDDNGITHYTQHPPPEGEAVEVNPETGVGSGAPDGGRAPGDGGAGDDETASAGNDGDGDGDGDSEPDTVEAYCERIRERVQLLAGDEPVRLKRDDGTLETLDDDARRARHTELQAQIAEHCED